MISYRVLFGAAWLLLLPAVAPAQQIPTPASVLGFEPGTDRRLVEWPVLVDYFRQLARASDRVQFRELGKTTLGAPFAALVITSPANMSRLEELRAINRRLADPRTITGPEERARLIADARTMVLITSSIHSTEVGTHYTPVVIADRLARGNSADILQILDQTVLLLVPSLNPDGISMVSNWYNRTLDTPAEGLGPPELYHHYIGHDNNRDWYAFTQVETQLTVDSMHNAWHPQIVHDIHQQSPFGARFFVPPFVDPVEPNVDPLIVAGFNSLGTHIAWEMIGQGKQGVVVNATYDAWTPARAYQHYHAGVRILSETASARLATPVEVGAGQLRDGRGFEALTSSWNFPAPWTGGRWTMADIIDYQVSGALALLRHAAAQRSTWLENFTRIGERAVRGWEGWPYAFVIPREGQDATRLNTVLGILHRGLVEVRTAERSFNADGHSWPAGSYVVVLRQPYAAFAKALLERQEYPNLRLYPGGPPRPPYDVTAHTLPLLMGIEAHEVHDSIAVPLSTPIAPPAPRYAYQPPTGRTPRIGLYRSYTASMDEGWTRWIFDTWSVPYTSVVDSVIRAGRLNRTFDVIVIPDMTGAQILNGLPPAYPAPYAGGLGDRGIEALRAFVRDGGTLITLNNSSLWAIDAFDLPVRNVLSGVSQDDFFAPGSIFRLELDTTHPISRNMPGESIAWFQRSAAFEVTDPSGARVVGRYPEDPARLLLSGWVLGAERVAGTGALVEATHGRGRVVLFGFRPQYRGQSLATYPLLFDALGSR